MTKRCDNNNDLERRGSAMQEHCLESLCRLVRKGAPIKTSKIKHQSGTKMIKMWLNNKADVNPPFALPISGVPSHLSHFPVFASRPSPCAGPGPLLPCLFLPLLEFWILKIFFCSGGQCSKMAWIAAKKENGVSHPILDGSSSFHPQWPSSTLSYQSAVLFQQNW